MGTHGASEIFSLSGLLLWTSVNTISHAQCRNRRTHIGSGCHIISEQRDAKAVEGVTV